MFTKSHGPGHDQKTLRSKRLIPPWAVGNPTHFSADGILLVANTLGKPPKSRPRKVPKTKKNTTKTQAVQVTGESSVGKYYKYYKEWCISNRTFWGETPNFEIPQNWSSDMARGKIPAPLGYWKLQFMDEIILIDRISTDYLISTPFSGHQENHQQLYIKVVQIPRKIPSSI